MMNRKTHVLLLASLVLNSFLAISGFCATEIVLGEGYWKPGELSFEREVKGTYLNPYREVELDTVNGPKTVTFEVTPAKGWSVDHWRKTFNTSFSDGAEGEEISNTKGVLTYTQGRERQDPVFIAVKFKHLSYDLKYDGNGATSPQGKSGVLYTNKITLAKAPTAPAGMSFKAWQDKKEKSFKPSAKVTGTNFTELATVHKDDKIVTLKAIWTNNVYTITFNANGGSVTPTSMTVEYGKKYGTLPTPTRNEYTFLGWYDGETEVTSSSTVTITANSELKAKWSRNTYTVSFGVTGDGQGTVSPTSATAASGQSVTVTATPAENSRFVRWTDGVTDAERQIVVKSTATYVANFEMKKYTVTFYWNAADGSATNESQSVRWGGDATAPEVPARTGYSFKGWDKSYTNVKDNLDVRAQYETVQCLIQFATCGGDGTGTVDQVSKEWGYGETFEVTATAAEGSEFIGWEDGDSTNPRKITVAGPSTYTVVFDLRRFDVTFNWKTGANVETQEVQRIAWGKAVTPPADAVVDSRIGYSWTGWDVSSDAFLSVKSNMTVTATYDPNRYTVAYDVTGVDDELYRPESQVVRYGDTFNLRVFDTRHKSVDGYDFLAWQRGDVQYDNGAEVSNLTAEADGVVTMKAVWDVGPLSRAMKCDNLYWREAEDYPGWKPGEESAVWHGNEFFADMVAEVKTNGVLSFDWKVDQTPFIGSVDLLAKEAILTPKTRVEREGWVHMEFEVPQHAPADQPDVSYGFPLELRISFENSNRAVVDGYVANVTWIPADSHPDPHDPDDAVTISSVEISGNKFKLSFMSDAKFDYNLLTNANLLIDSWGVMKYEPGTGTTIVFEPEILPGVPQMFYKVETIRKK